MTVNTADYDSIGKMALNDARQAGMKIIASSKSKAAKIMRINRDISRAPSATEVVRILWMSALAAEGLCSLDSNWNKI